MSNTLHGICSTPTVLPCCLSLEGDEESPAQSQEIQKEVLIGGDTDDNRQAYIALVVHQRWTTKKCRTLVRVL